MFCGVWSTWTVCLCYHSSLWVIFSAPKSLCVLIPRSSLPTKSRQPLIFVPSPEFCLPECHIVGINHCADFSDCLLLLAICIYIFVSFHALIAHFFFFFFFKRCWILFCCLDTAVYDPFTPASIASISICYATLNVNVDRKTRLIFFPVTHPIESSHFQLGLSFT